MSIELSVETGSQVNLYGNTYSLRVLAGMVDAVAKEGGVAFLERHGPQGADLVFFRGTDTPLDFSTYRLIRRSIAALGAGRPVASVVRPETSTDRRDEPWRQQNLVTVRTQDHAVLVGGSALGLRLCALDCLFLADTDKTDHEHWDHPYFLGTSKSVELIVRNVDRQQE